MKRFASKLFTVFLFFLIAPNSSAIAKEQWTRVQSENFTLVGNASEREIREVAVRLEQYRRILANLFTGSRVSQTVPTTVLVFKDDKAFKPFRPVFRGRVTDVAGYFQPGRDLNYIAVSAEQDGARSFSTIFHEFGHLFVDNNLRGLPLCINEGLAEYLSLLKISEDGSKITLGSVGFQRFRLLNERKLLSLTTLLSTGYESDYYNEGDQRSIFYAQSWALVHYLLHLDGRNGIERFTRFLTLLTQGSSLDDGLKQVYDSNVVELEKALKMYVRQYPYPTSVMNFDQSLKAVADMRSMQITEAHANAYVGDLLLHLNRIEEAETYLQKSLTVNPAQVTALASLGMLRIKQDRTREAVQLLRRAAAADPKNFLTQYYYAYALSRESVGMDEAIRGYHANSANEMRAALDRAIELSPNFIESYRLQAFLNLVRNEQLDKAENLLKHALGLAPGRLDLMFLLAQVHLRGLKFQAVRSDLEPILNQTADAKLREQASDLLDDLKFVEDQASRPDFVARKSDEPISNPDSADALPQQAHALRPRLVKRFKGERVLGFLTEIECSEEGVTLIVRVGKQTLRLHAEELRSVFFVTYVTGLERTVTCGTRKSQSPVVITYRSSSEPRAKFDGEAIAIEFVPEDIELEP